MGEEIDINEQLEKLRKILRENKSVEMQNVDFSANELELHIKPMKANSTSPRPKPVGLTEASFTPPTKEYAGEIVEVKLGATKNEGGTRDRVRVIGGEKVPPFYRFEATAPNKPVIAFDVFDMKIHLPKPVRMHFEDVLEDPAEWARRCVEKFGAEMITIHLISTDPLTQNTSTAKAAKIVENVLQAVKVPIAIGGCGNPDKDPEVLEKAAEVASGERVLLNSARRNMDYKRVAKAANAYGHVVLSVTELDLNNQKMLNRELLDAGVSKDRIVMDPTTAALGYGIEYSFSVMERIRLAGLLGDKDLQMPLASGTTNTWAAREAWMESAEWGPRELRGPLWEITTGLTL
ncbi:MAG TPA: CO dehydrogenase/acetyl-CoA synthase subunit delta, partial [archaeon]|nr:CO dehydrogenase/acetyl-CoA synthase subunit delta [archaeon]